MNSKIVLSEESSFVYKEQIFLLNPLQMLNLSTFRLFYLYIYIYMCVCVCVCVCVNHSSDNVT